MSKQAARKQEALKSSVGKAVVLAEAFGNPPFCYAPLCVESALEKVIQSVERAHIREIYVYGHRRDPLRAFLAARKRINADVKELINEHGQTFGDAMRFLHETDLFREPFVLISGDVVTDLSLTEVIQAFVAGQQSNSSLLLLKTFYQREAFLPSDQWDEELLVYDPQHHVIKLYEAMKPNNRSHLTISENNKFSFKRLVADDPKDREGFCIRFDLRDAGISVCAPDLIKYYQENFDFQSERDHFFRDLLHSEINDFVAAAFVLDDSTFLKRVTSPYECLRTSQLLIKGCLNYFYLNKSEFECRRNNRIVAKSAKMDVSTVLGESTFVGPNCVVKAKADVESCTLVGNCTVGEESVLRSCYLADGSVVQKGTRWTNVILLDKEAAAEAPLSLTNSVVSSAGIRAFQITGADDDDDLGSLMAESEEEEEDKEALFKKEAAEIFSKNSGEANQISNILNEVVNARLASNIEPRLAAAPVFTCVLGAIKFEALKAKEIEGALKPWFQVVNRFTNNDRLAAISLADAGFEYCRANKGTSFNLLLQGLFKVHFMSKAEILEWADSAEAPEKKAAVEGPGLRDFIEWLRQPEEEEDEEEEEEEEDA